MPNLSDINQAVSQKIVRSMAKALSTAKVSVGVTGGHWPLQARAMAVSPARGN